MIDLADFIEASLDEISGKDNPPVSYMAGTTDNSVWSNFARDAEPVDRTGFLDAYEFGLVSGEPLTARAIYQFPDTHAKGDRGLRYGLRDLFIERFGFAVISRDAVDILKGLGPLVEVGAGSGSWACAINRSGGDVVATDPTEPFWKFETGRYAETAKLTAKQAVQAYPERAVLSVWASYDDDWLYQAVRHMAVGRTLAIVTEGQGGCIADDHLHSLLGRDFERVLTEHIPQFSGMHDRLEVHVRRRRTPHRWFKRVVKAENSWKYS